MKHPSNNQNKLKHTSKSQNNPFPLSLLCIINQWTSCSTSLSSLIKSYSQSGSFSWPGQTQIENLKYNRTGWRLTVRRLCVCNVLPCLLFLFKIPLLLSKLFNNKNIIISQVRSEKNGVSRAWPLWIRSFYHFGWHSLH